MKDVRCCCGYLFFKGIYVGGNITCPNCGKQNAFKQKKDRTPLVKKRDEVLDFVNNHRGNFNFMSTFTIFETLDRAMGDVSGVSSLLTGQESRLDPNAPGKKDKKNAKQQRGHFHQPRTEFS